MKKIVYILVLMVCLSSCGLSDAQIEAAIELTQLARPTDTEVPEPTNTPSIEPSPTIKPTSTPKIDFLEDLTNEDVIKIFENMGANCGDQVKESDGSYTYSQQCNGTLSDGMVIVQIGGQSDDTVLAYFAMFVQYTGKDISDEAEDTFLNMTSFGSHSNEMQSWVKENLPKILSSDEELEFSTEISGVVLMLSGSAEVLTLLLMPSQ